MTSRIIKIIITTLIVIIVLVGAVVLWGAASNKGGANSGESSSAFGTLFSLFNGPPQSSTSSSPLATIQSDSGALVSIPRLREISASPVAGDAFIQRNVASTTVDNLGQVKKVTLLETFIRYVDRATGHIFETKPDSISVAEVTNTTVPKIYDALFTSGGNSLILRFLGSDQNTIETDYGLVSTSTTATSSSIASTSSPLTLFTYSLPENIISLAMSPATEQIFYLKAAGQGAGGSVGTLAGPNNSHPKQIFSYPLSEWQLGWPKSTTITLTTKPESNVNGYLFFMNTSTGGLTKILGNVPGLTILASPDLSSVLFSESNSNGFNLNIFNTKTGGASTLSLATLPEKCVWSHKQAGIVYCAVPISIPNAAYPESWYQGVTTFSDNFWQINTNTGDRNLIARSADYSKQLIDATNLSLDSNENYLMFTNKKDLSLWDLLIATPPGPIISTSTTATTTTTSSAITPTSTPYTPPSH